MAAADEAARLRERADALDAESKLEKKLAEAKEAYRDNPDDAKAKDRLHKVRDDITAARQVRRDGGVTITGDAFQSNGNEG